MPSVISGPSGPGVPAHPAMVAALRPGLGQAPDADHARRSGAGLAPRRSGQVEQVAEPISRVDDNQIFWVQFRLCGVLCGPCVADVVAEVGDTLPCRPPALVIHAHLPPAYCRRCHRSAADNLPGGRAVLVTPPVILSLSGHQIWPVFEQSQQGGPRGESRASAVSARRVRRLDPGPATVRTRVDTTRPCDPGPPGARGRRRSRPGPGGSREPDAGAGWTPPHLHMVVDHFASSH